MHTIFYLPNCSTCTKVLKEVAPDTRFDLQNLKENPITAEQLENLDKALESIEEQRRVVTFSRGACALDLPVSA